MAEATPKDEVIGMRSVIDSPANLLPRNSARRSFEELI